MGTRITGKVKRSMVVSLVVVWFLWSLLFQTLWASSPSSPPAGMVQTDSAVADRNIVPVAHLPGIPTGALQVVDEIAYLGMGNELVALDLADPTRPLVMGHVAVPDLVPNFVPPRPLVVQAHTAYVAPENTLYAFDVSDPTHLLPINSLAFDSFIKALAATDHRLFVGVANQVWIVDAQNPQKLKILSAYDFPGPVSSMAVQGNYLYVVANGLHVLEISANSGAPVLRVSVEVVNADKVLITPTRAYVLNSTRWRITVINIVTPAAPAVLGNYDSALQDAVVLHEHLVVVGDALQIIDLNDPTSAKVLRTAPLPPNANLRNIVVVGDQIYLMGEELFIYDASINGNLAKVGGYHPTFYEANDILVQDQYAYVADTMGFAVLDTSTPTMPQRISVLTDTVGNLYQLAGKQNVIYAAGVSWLYAIDITDPLAPQATVAYTDRVGSSIYQVTVADNLVFVPEDGNEASYLVILDATDPRHLQAVGRQQVSHLPTDFTAAGHYLYVTDGFNLQVIDVSTPATPQVVGMYHSDRQDVGKVVVSGNLAYIADSGNHITIIDVGDPTNITVVGEYHYPVSWRSRQLMWVVDLAVEGNYAYVLEQFGSMLVINVANPTSPFEAGRYTADTQLRSVTLHDKELFVAQAQAGISILAFAPPVVTTTLTSAGAIFPAERGQVTYTFPPEFVATTTVVTHTTRYLDEFAATLSPLLAAQDGFMLTSDAAERVAPLQFSQPYTIQVDYTEEQLGPIIEETLALYAWNGATWQREPTSTLDAVHNRVIAQTTAMSIWALLGEADRLYVPLISNRNVPH